MKILGVTIGCGKKFKFMAHAAMQRFLGLYNLPAVVLGEDFARERGYSQPQHMKFDLFNFYPDFDAIVYFDADVVFVERFDLVKEIKKGFTAVLDQYDQDWIIEDADRAKILPQKYINTGLLLIPSDCRDVLMRARSLIGTIDTPFYDQTHINAALHMQHVDVNYLPTRYNFPVSPIYTATLDRVVVAHIRFLKDMQESMIKEFFMDPHEGMLRYRNARVLPPPPLPLVKPK